MDSGHNITHYTSHLKIPDLHIASFHQLLFSTITGRSGDSNIILGHVGNHLIQINLADLQSITRHVYAKAHENGIMPGQTVLLARVDGCSELYTALLLIALTAYGLRVFLPMYLEADQLEEWIKVAQVSRIILPEKEVSQLDAHHREKEQVEHIIQIAKRLEVSISDFQDDFKKPGLLPDLNSIHESTPDIPPGWIESNDLEQESLIVTTSGTSGQSKLVVYTQRALLRSCQAWETAGLFSKDKMGGRSFTPLISHTMGIRGLFNAIWSGYPVCLINSNYFTEKPEITRYFLLEMKPENITGGPAVYHMLLEMIRLYPELRDGLQQNLTTLVSSGAGFDLTTVEMIENVFDKTMHNAFGTTETQQVTNTLLTSIINQGFGSILGDLLPGVEVELRPEKDQPGFYSFHVFSPFMSKYSLCNDEIHQQENDRFFDTKDLVQIDDTGHFIYVGRQGEDFFKDGFGVKIPWVDIKGYYARLIKRFDFVHFVPVHAFPGLALLIFHPLINKTIGDREKIKQLIKDRNAELKNQLSLFEYNHRHIVAFIVIHATAPVTRKGNVSIHAIKETYSAEVTMLENLFSRNPEVSLIEEEPDIGLYAEYSNPHLGYMTWAMKANWNYHRGQGDELFTFIGGEEVPVIDFVGGYGSGLLGHNHPKIREAIKKFIDSDAIPLSDQFSKHSTLGQLARALEYELSSIHGIRFITLFGSTGAEVAEMALHHAYLEWIRKIKKLQEEQFRQFADNEGERVRVIWEDNWKKLSKARIRVVTHCQGYHGLTSGVRSLLGDGERRETFKGLLAVKSIPIDDLQTNWKSAFIQAAEEAVCEINLLKMENKEVRIEMYPLTMIIASIFEPIIGEGGVRVINSSVFEYFAEQDFPLIFDEIQTGLGRTGKFLASSPHAGDYYLFSKSLGGNYEKIAALVIRKSRFQEKVQKYYLSTFSLGALSARTAIATLDIIKQENIPEMASQKGTYLMEGLHRLMNRYPAFIKRVGGEGVMCGLEMHDMVGSTMILLKILSKHELLGYLCAAYLLNIHHIRVLPTLSAPETLRFEPSAYITNDQIDQLIIALHDFFLLLETQNTYQLLKFLMDDDPFNDNKGFQPEQGSVNGYYDEPANGARIVASIIHFAYPTEELRLMDPSLIQASDTGLRLLFSRFHSILGGKSFLLSALNIHQDRIHLRVYSLFADSAEMEQLQKEGRRNKMIQNIQEAVDLAAFEGAEVISLGGYTSILTRNGTQIVPPPNTRVITGNSLTAGMGVQRMLKEMKSGNHKKEEITIGVVGATGNIGSLIARELLKTEAYAHLILITRRQISQEDAIQRFNLPIGVKVNWDLITFSTKLTDLKRANYIVAVSNTSIPIIYPHHLQSDKQVSLFDVSLPSAVSMEVRQLENIRIIPFTAFAALPYDPDYVLSTCTPKGTLFCCIAEAILCALETIPNKLTGRIDPEAVDTLIQMAKKQNMLAGLEPVKSFKR